MRKIVFIIMIAMVPLIGCNKQQSSNDSAGSSDSVGSSDNRLVITAGILHNALIEGSDNEYASIIDYKIDYMGIGGINDVQDAPIKVYITDDEGFTVSNQEFSIKDGVISSKGSVSGKFEVQVVGKDPAPREFKIEVWAKDRSGGYISKWYKFRR